MNNYYYCLGILNLISHDPSACIVRLKLLNDGGYDLDYIHFEEGMLNRRKKSYAFPLLAIQACCNYYGITAEEINIVATDFAEQTSFSTPSAKNRKIVGDFIKSKCAFPKENIHFFNHHLAHAYTAVWPSGFPATSVLVIDGSGSSYETSTIYEFTREKGMVEKHKKYGTGIGVLYTLVTKELAFRTGEEGKTMGLAPFGMNYTEMDDKLPDFTGIDEGPFTDYSNVMRRFPSHGLKVHIERRNPDESAFSPYHSRLAYNVQKELERSVLRTVQHIHTASDSRHLCYAGGVALNCVANAKIIETDLFKNVFFQPNCGDAGITLGLALIAAEKQILKLGLSTDKFWQCGPSKFNTYSPICDDLSIFDKFCRTNQLTVHQRDDQMLVEELIAGKVVAYFEGGWEFGPRALGHRSFLASAADESMKDTLNKKIKHREAYRPFAPIVLKEKFHEYFESKIDDHPFMLTALPVKSGVNDKIPAVVHVDGTARVQTISENAGNVYNLLQAYLDRTGSAVLVNTSFNDNNEPIVGTAMDALSCFLRTNSDLLVVEDRVIFRTELSNPSELLLRVTEENTDYVRKLYEEALNSSLFIKKQVADESILGYTARNILRSLYHRHVVALERLETLVASGELHQYPAIITDKHHYAILTRICEEEKVPLPDVVDIMEDDLAHLFNANIPEDALILLYNATIANMDQIDRGLSIRNWNMFYKWNECMISMEFDEIDNQWVQDVLKSYEVDRDQSLPQFLDARAFPKFITTYLSSGQLSDINRKLFLELTHK